MEIISWLLLAYSLVVVINAIGYAVGEKAAKEPRQSVIKKGWICGLSALAVFALLCWYVSPSVDEMFILCGLALVVTFLIDHD